MAGLTQNEQKKPYFHYSPQGKKGIKSTWYLKVLVKSTT